MTYYCIEAPCAHQDPTPELEQIGNEWRCPYCHGWYTEESLKQITEATEKASEPQPAPQPKTGFFLGDSLKNFHLEVYDYLFFSPPCYEDLKVFGVDKRKPESYKLFLNQFIPRANPRLGTVTVSFTGQRRTDGRVLSKTFYLQQVMFDAGYYLRDIKHVMKGSKYNAYGYQMLDVLTFQKNGTKAIYNLGKNKAYGTYGLDCWGPFNKELLIAGEVVGQPIEIADRCIQNFTNKHHIVFDPFAGIGTTCAAAKELEREYLGYELREEIHSFGVKKYSI
jgi:hypothetical protein